MPAYFFRLCENAILLDDDEGMNLPDAEAARQLAIINARCIMADAVRRGLLDLSPSIEVYDTEGARVLSVPFTEAIDLHGLERS